jgi:hypothetical protein
VGKIEVVDRPMTAMTNGRDVTYGREFVESLADKELNFIKKDMLTDSQNVSTSMTGTGQPT